jgi:hypothetical protein
MANKDNPKGAKLIGSLESATFNAVTNRYVIPASDSNDFYRNDFVKTNNTSEDGIPICVKAAAGDESRGIIVAFEATKDYENQTYRTGSTRRIAYVADDPYILFEMQVNAAITSTNIGKNYDIVVAAGDSATGISGTQVDISTATTAAAQVKILSIIPEEENEVGEFAKVQCMFVEHELAVTGASSTVKHNELVNLTYDTAGHGNGYTGFQRGTTLSAIDPTVTDDDSKNYVKGDLWLNTANNRTFVCTDESTGAAVWKEDLTVNSVFNVVAATGITPISSTANHVVIPIQSSTAGAVDITANPQIAAGAFDGQMLTLIGQDDTKTVQIDDGTGFALENGVSFTFGSQDTWHGISYSSVWIELTRSDN